VARVGAGVLAEPLPYTVPGAQAGLDLPAAFFLNGWLWAMTNAELAAYLMFRHLGCAYPRVHAESGVYIHGQDRVEQYGLGRDTYESHILLERFGLLALVPSLIRHPDGRVAGFKKGERLEAHRFQLIDEGLAQPGVENVIARLEEL
jgi:hypothetical protein